MENHVLLSYVFTSSFMVSLRTNILENITECNKIEVIVRFISEKTISGFFIVRCICQVFLL